VFRTGKWTVQQAAELSVPAPTIEAALDGRFLSGLKDERMAAAKIFDGLGLKEPSKHEVCAHLPVRGPCDLVPGT
jgi:6-phosphogluconate dehydrogenase